MSSLNQKGLAHIYALFILVIGLIVAVYLVQQTQIFNPQAAYKQDVDPILYEQRLAGLKTKFHLPDDISRDDIEDTVKEDLLNAEIVVEGSIAQGDAVVTVIGECIDQETNFTFSEYGAFPPICLSEQQEQKMIEVVQSGAETAADFIIPYSSAKEAIMLDPEMQDVKSLLASSGIEERNSLSSISGQNSNYGGYIVTLIRLKELQKDVQDNPDGSGNLTKQQEEARRQYLAALAKLWEKQHNLLIALSGEVALSVIEVPLKSVGVVAKPLVGRVAANVPDNPISSFLRRTWNTVIRRVPDNVYQLQEEINSRLYNVPLNVMNIPRPRRSNAIDPVKANQWVNAHPEGIARDTARAILNETRHITQQEFETALKKSLEKFSKELDGEDYVVFVQPGKSNQWVTELAMQDVDYLPAQVYNLASGSTRENLSNYRRFVFFDDALYSGLQMRGNINSIVDHAINQGIDPASITVDVVVPFSAKYAVGNIENASKVKINIHHIEEIPSATESLSKYGQDTLKQAQAPAIRPRDTYHSGMSVTHNTDNKILLYFDHKIPDQYSSIEDVYLYGNVYDNEGYPMNIKIPFIPETHPPYK